MVGNTPNYNSIDILRCFLRLGGNIGREKLAKELELGEGTIRTILDILKSKNFISSTKKGHFLSSRGSHEFDKIIHSISMPDAFTEKALYPEYKKIGVHVKNAPPLKHTYKLRDIAVKNGAEGAIILKFDGRLYAPEAGVRQNFGKLEEQFDFSSGDVLVVGFSNDKRGAENGALAAAVEISGALKKFIKKL
ncbi:DUF4443 domain-containing protein [Candidatus Woesearchaeota archaeon]|nr:DUF4443 domain-containing protein [Candidatus Woesearchaeota archaeon]